MGGSKIMDYNNLFKNGSLKFISQFVEKVVYDGFGAEKNELSQQVILLVSAIIVLFLLYKLVWLVWKTIKFIISRLEW